MRVGRRLRFVPEGENTGAVETERFRQTLPVSLFGG